MTESRKGLYNAIKVDVPPPFSNLRYPGVADHEDIAIHNPPRKKTEIK